ncbi:hematopoietic progenitor cell antigen CD34-like [Arapaima gigas]
MAVVLTVCALLLLDGAACNDETATTSQTLTSKDSPSTSGDATAATGIPESPKPSTAAEDGTTSTQFTTAGSSSATAIPTTIRNQITTNIPGDSVENITVQHPVVNVPSTVETSLTTVNMNSTLESRISTILKRAEEGSQNTENKASPRPMENIHCVNKEAVKDQDAVLVKLQHQSNCDNTKAVLRSYVTMLCGQDCELSISQEDNSNTLIVTAKNSEAAPKAMSEHFKSKDIKNELGVLNAEPSWSKRSPTVLVSLLLAGLLLLAALLGSYCLKMHRGHSSKGMRLAEESYHGDEENQGNTLVSVAPLKQPEPQEKPNINGESPDGGKSQPPSTTNGHSATKNPVADTEL